MQGTLNFAPALLPRPNWEQKDAVAKERKNIKKSRTKKRTKTRNGKRDLINTGSDKRFVRRGTMGRFKESDDVGPFACHRSSQESEKEGEVRLR
jgi:hypothetical protein